MHVSCPDLTVEFTGQCEGRSSHPVRAQNEAASPGSEVPQNDPWWM